MTKQEIAENLHKEYFLKNYIWNGDNVIIHEYTSAENKELNTDADYMVTGKLGTNVLVSLKTDGGTMCCKNTGTQTQFAKKFVVKELELIQEQSMICRARRNEYKGLRFDEFSSEEANAIKGKLIQPWIDTYIEILSIEENFDSFIAMYNNGKAHWRLVGETLKRTSAFIPTNKEVYQLTDRTLYVGGLHWRFKSEGGKADSTIKGVISE